MSINKCRFCGCDLKDTFVDLGLSPLANGYLTAEDCEKEDSFFPLKAMVCSNCFLVQVGVYSHPRDIFKNYRYISSSSKTWLKHAEQYVNMIILRLNLDETSLVGEIASNDGYLLQYFKKANIKNFGIEPASNLAERAREKGLDIVCDFFTNETANYLSNEKGKVDLLIANNVLAHVPDINDFMAGMKPILKQNGTITVEFPHLLNVIKEVQFDTIYHEHFSYLSFFVTNKLFNKHDLKIYDVEKLATHGGSLRIYATHIENEIKINDSVYKLLDEEFIFGLTNIDTYKDFQCKINNIKYNALIELSKLKLQRKSLIAYGAAAKGNTFLNYCGIGKEFFEYIADITPEKQGLYLPGTLIPIVDENYIEKTKPDYIIVLPWNWKNEIKERLAYTKEWGCKLVTLIPKIDIF